MSQRSAVCDMRAREIDGGISVRNTGDKENLSLGYLWPVSW